MRKTSERYILADGICNLTNAPIYMYEEDTGKIEKFEPIDIKDIAEIIKTNDNFQYYVVDNCQTLIDLLLLGGKLDDIALISNQCLGRNHKNISYLIQAVSKISIRYQSSPKYA